MKHASPEGPNDTGTDFSPMLYKSKTLQTRLTPDEFARLEKIVAWLNAPGDWEERSERKKVIAFNGWGSVTTSDVVRFLINGRAVDVLHSRISPRSTKTRVKRTTRSRRAATR